MRFERPLLFLSLAFLFAAPAAAAKKPDKRALWDKNWGPLVPHTKFTKSCKLCHVPDRWDVIRPDFHFDHLKETGYPLRGAHAAVACLRCHNDRAMTTQAKPRGCVACHVDPHKNAFGLQCTTCHNESAWKASGQQTQKIADHARTGFPLTGLHATIDCTRCHMRAQEGDFKGTPRDCFSCHQRDFQAAPQHAAMNYPHDCTGCHTTAAWPTTTFNHAFLGAGVNNCVSCHMPDYQKAPNHVAQNYPTTCANCHTTASWLANTFDHSKLDMSNPNCVSCHLTDYQSAKATPASNHVLNNFPQSCEKCHNTTAFSGTVMTGNVTMHAVVGSFACYSCHSNDYLSMQPSKPDGNHAGNGFPTSSPICEQCHANAASSFATWAGMDMANATKHSFVSNMSCYQCHSSDFRGAVSPLNHSNLNPSQCASCHTDFTSWMNATQFDHSGLGNPPNPTCVSCHLSDYNGAKTTPASNHAANGFPQTCEKCHNTTAFAGTVMTGNSSMHNVVASMPCSACHTGEFNSAKQTPASNHAANGFPTTSPACQTCHSAAASNFSSWAGVVMTGSSVDHGQVGSLACYNCHQAEFAASKPSPASNHTANGFPTSSPACQNCHTTAASSFSSWAGVVMTGSSVDHAQVNSLACYNCHQAEFNSAKQTPASNHAANGFPTSSPACQNCHTTAASNFSSWAGVVMTGSSADHSQVSSLACYRCHAAEFNSATVTPASMHVANGFPTTSPGCQTCHSLAATSYSAWSGVVMTGSAVDHGVVGGPAGLCQSCHMAEFNGATSPQPHSGFSPSTCNSCHTDFSSWMNFVHTPSNCYNSGNAHSHHNATCLQCHGSTTNFLSTPTCGTPPNGCHRSNQGNSCN